MHFPMPREVFEELLEVSARCWLSQMMVSAQLKLEVGAKAAQYLRSRD